MDKKERKEIRGFSIAFFIILSFFGGLNLYRQAQLTGTLLVAGGILLLLSGLFAPFILKPIYWVWRKVTLVISTVVMTVLLTVLYYLLFTPIGWLLKVFRKEVMPLGADKSKNTYWEKRTVQEETLEDFKHQF